MSRAKICAVVLLCRALTPALASEVSGKIIIEKSANKKIVPPTPYDLRGVAVSATRSGSSTSAVFERVALWLEPNNVSSAAAAVKATMRQRNQQLEPDLLIVPIGSTVDFPNFDPIFHNIFSLSRTRSFDLGYYSEGRSRSVTFPHAGIVQIYCHVHPNMYAAIVVTASRWSGKPSQDGSFSWSDVPPGKYLLCVWQKSVGVVHRGILVPELGPVHISVSIPEGDPEK
jgi:plastocyanin